MTDQKKILLVEDEGGLRELYEEELTKLGYLVFAVGNGEEAIDLSKQNDFALLVLDIMLPGMSGLDVLARLRTDKKFEKTPVLVLSALEAVEDRARGLALGASAYCSKNELSPEQLGAKVGELLTGS